MTATNQTSDHRNSATPVIADLRYYYAQAKSGIKTELCDLCIYGGTSGGVAAAIQAARMGKSVILLEFGNHIGGLTSGGLCDTDGGDPDVCGGIAREFYNQVGQRFFEPSRAEETLLSMLNIPGIRYHFFCQLESVQKAGTKIQSITMENGLTVQAKQFIDCSYEGDLMAMAGVSFTVGRESNAQYGETYNGVLEPGKGGHDYTTAIDPYLIPGNPDSGLLPRIHDQKVIPGIADKRIQAFCFRMWLTDKDPQPFPLPEGYDPLEYEVIARMFESGADPKIMFSNDTNNHHLFDGAYFIDLVSGADQWPEGDHKTREHIFQNHVRYQIGVMWFLQNDPRIPSQYQSIFKKWGLPKDIYTTSGGWPHQLYIREGRRMVSDYVVTEHHCFHREIAEDSIGLATYKMDSHHCQMVAIDGLLYNEGNIEVSPRGPYPIAYRAITPKQSECTNLLVPWALSASHITFGSIRMEPVFMVLGQSAATAACFAIDDNIDVQSINYGKLRAQLIKDQQKL